MVIFFVVLILFKMVRLEVLVFLLMLCVFQMSGFQCESCSIETDVNGGIGLSGYLSQNSECWKIPVPTGYFALLQVTSIESEHYSCKEDYLEIAIAETNEVFEFCSSDNNRKPVTALFDATVIHYVSANYERYTGFSLEFSIKTKECLTEDNFKCDNNTCILPEKVCNGVKDCKDGVDEIGCEKGVRVTEAREKAISWLKQKRTPAWGWRANTPRAVVALYLASAVHFNGTNFEEELMAKQTELKTAVALLRSSLSNSELSLFIHALLVTCHCPRQFYGNNLVKRLKDQVEESRNIMHPLAYLALCNANETWPHKAISDLTNILNSSSEYPFIKDLQAMAILALSCEANHSRNVKKELSNKEDNIITLYKKTIQNFKNLQAQDGSFGNVHTTALITQALFSIDEDHNRGWNLAATMKYLMKELNSSSVDFLTTYLTLPILNGKSLTDISLINCSANRRKHGDDPGTEINDYLGPKIRVQYSLYIGDAKDVVHTIFLRVPENSTASQVMELAQVEDPKYKFEWKKVLGKMYVYGIGNLLNDPEAGKFWLLYVDTIDTSGPFNHLIKGPDEVIMSNEEHLVFWYKTATL